jgi:hypothetical protein
VTLPVAKQAQNHKDDSQACNKVRVPCLCGHHDCLGEIEEDTEPEQYQTSSKPSSLVSLAPRYLCNGSIGRCSALGTECGAFTKSSPTIAADLAFSSHRLSGTRFMTSWKRVSVELNQGHTEIIVSDIESHRFEALDHPA